MPRCPESQVKQKTEEVFFLLTGQDGEDVTTTPPSILEEFRFYVRDRLREFNLGEEMPTVNQTASWDTTREHGGRRAKLAEEMKGME